MQGVQHAMIYKHKHTHIHLYYAKQYIILCWRDDVTGGIRSTEIFLRTKLGCRFIIRKRYSWNICGGIFSDKVYKNLFQVTYGNRQENEDKNLKIIGKILVKLMKGEGKLNYD